MDVPNCVVVLYLLTLCCCALGTTVTPVVNDIFPHHGSLSGGSRITIKGSGFENDTFDWPPGNNKGNLVNMISLTRSYVCDIHKDGVASDKIACYTRPMEDDYYYLEVIVNGVPMNQSNYCPTDPDLCRFNAREYDTPTVSSISSQSGPPGKLITIDGRIMTRMYEANDLSRNATNGILSALIRAYGGDKICELIQPSGGLYNLQLHSPKSRYGNFTCKMTTKYIGPMRISYLIENYGRSKPCASLVKLYPRNATGMYLQYPVINEIGPIEGSSQGYTYVTITGAGLNDTTKHDIIVQVGGVDCEELQDVTYYSLVCVMPPQSKITGSFFKGNRGGTLRTWTTVQNTSLGDVTSMDTSDATFQSTHLDSANITVNKGMVGYAEMLFVPPSGGMYHFKLLADSGCQCMSKISETMDPADATVLNDNCNTENKELTMTAGKTYFIQIIFSTELVSSESPVTIRMSMFRLQAPHNAGHHDGAKNEVQSINLSGEDNDEVQSMTLPASPAVSGGADEVQTITITSVDSTLKFRLQLHGVATGLLSSQITAADLQEVINNLPCVPNNIVTVTKVGSVYTVTFTDNLGNWPEFVVLHQDDGVTVVIAEVTVGQSDNSKVIIQHKDFISPPINADASKASMEAALDKLFSVSCPKLKLSGSKYNSYESNDNSWNQQGTVTAVSEPFCGKSVLKNPKRLFYAGSTVSKWISLTNSGNKWMCFAYRGIFRQSIAIYYGRHFTDNGEQKLLNHWATINTFNFSNDVTRWHYNCFNVLEFLENKHSQASFYFIRRILVSRHSDAKDDAYIDELTITSKPPVPDYQDLPNQRGVPPVRATVKVTKADTQYTMTIDPWDCEPLDILSIRDEPTGGVTHTRIQTGSVPVGGNAKLTRNGKNFVFPANAKAFIVASILENTDPDLGRLKVSRADSCHGFSYRVEWMTKPGKQEPFQFDGSDLTGPPGVSGMVKEINDGGALYDPIPGYTLYTAHTVPAGTTQYPVTMEVNYLAAECNATSSCMFTYSTAQMPTATDIQPRTGTKGTVVVVTGTRFDETTITNNILHLGSSGVPCVVSTATTTSFTCTLGAGDSGTFNAVVLVRGKGAAETTPAIDFVYTVSFVDYVPTSSGLGGGLVMTLAGSGLNKTSLTVEIGGTLCPMVSADMEKLLCVIPLAASASSVDVVLKDAGTVLVTHSTQFQYDSSLSPIIATINSTTGSPKGGEILLIVGTGFGSKPVRKVKLVDKTNAENVYLATVIRWSDTGFDVSLPPLSHGTYQFEVIVPDAGYATLSAGLLPEITSTFELTDFNPKETSIYGGQLFTITGNGLSSDTAVKIGDTKCTVETSTSTEIVCHLEPVYKTHEIVSTGEDNGYKWDPASIEVELGDVVHWSWSSDAKMPPKYLVQQTETQTSTEPLENGFDSLERMAEGGFSYVTEESGTTYYWSGQVSDILPEITPRGQITVIPKTGSIAVISVTENKIEAKYSPASSPGRRRRETSCPSTYKSQCTNDLSPTPGVPSIIVTPCLTGVFNAMEPTYGTLDTTITISGSGFGTDVACARVRMGDKLLDVISVTDTEIQVKVKADDPPPVFVKLPIEVELLGKGNVFNFLGENARSFKYNSNVLSVQPTSGSIGGNTLFTITGGGFVGNEMVNIDGVPCSIDTTLTTTTQMICSTGSRSTEVTSLPLEVTVQGFNVATFVAHQFSYLDSMTPKVLSVTPTSVPDPEANTGSTTLTIAGEHFSTDVASITVEIGDVPCAVVSAALDSIQCTVSNLPVGMSKNMIMVNVKPLGDNKFSDGVKVNGLKLIREVIPMEGSIKGSTLITLTGNGFTADTTVTIDGAPCPTTSITLVRVICKTPEHAAAAVDVVVTSSGETYDAVTYTFSDAATPTVDSISPTSSYEIGASVTITGTRFSSTAAENNVTINDIVCTPTSASDTQVICQLGSAPAGTYPVVVNVAGKGLAKHTTATTFKYDIAISAISPTEGSYGGEQVVTITGQGLSTSTVVKICDVPCTLLPDATTAMQYVCTTPSHSGSGDTPCDVIAVSGMVTTTALSGVYTYKDSLTATVTAISPARGGTGGGVLVTVTGSNFGTDTTLLEVKIDDVPCTMQSISDLEFVCKTGEHHLNVMAPVAVNKQGQGQAKYTSENFHYIDVWSSIYTWGGISLPEKGDFVVVPVGMTLLLDTDTPILKLLLIQGGTLIFDDTKPSIELNAENILIVDGGSFQIGTSEQPYQNNAIITLHGHVRAPELPVYGAKTFAVRNGSVELHGNPTPSTWTLLAQTAEVGDTSLTLQIPPMNWKINDYIIVASTGDHKSQHQNEKLKITNIDGATITFDPPLKYRHLGITEVYGSTHLELRAEVGLLTHNIVFRGSINEQFVTNIPACPEQHDPGQFATQKCLQGRFGDEIGSDQFGAALMFHNPVKDSDAVHVHIEYVEITFAGQAFRLGRYPIHFHRNGDMVGSYIRGCSIHWTFNRAINIHDTHWLLIEHNVIYNVMGGAVFLEDSIEHDNTLQYNLVLFVIASSSLLNDDITPAGFWVTHPSNIVRHNHIAGGTHFGIWYRMHEHPIGPSYDPYLCPRKGELYEFYNNTVHSVGWYGLWIFEYYDPMMPTAGSQCSWNTPAPAIFKNLIAWNCFRGAEFVEGGSIQFQDFVVANNYMAGLEAYFIHNNVPRFSEKGAMFNGTVVIGHLNYDGHPSCTQTGLVLPFANALLMKRTSFYNFQQDVQGEGGEVCGAIGTVKIICVCSHLCSGYNYKFVETYWDSTATAKGNFEWANQLQLEDADGTLTGQGPGARVYADSEMFPECQSDAEFGIRFPAKVCPASLRTNAVRFTFNKPNPTSLLFKKVRFQPVDDSGVANGPAMEVPWADKRDTHAEGWLAVLHANRTYLMTFVGMERVTNLTYDGEFYGLEEYNWIKIMHGSMFNDEFEEFDTLQTIASAPTALMLDHSPQYGDSDGAVEFTTTDSDKRITYLISGQNKGAYANTAVSFKAIKCYYPGCVVPKGSEIDIASERPDDSSKWSESSSWVKGSTWLSKKQNQGTASEIPPVSSATHVKIASGTWVVVDVPLIEVDLLEIEGTLEFEHLPMSTADDGQPIYLNHVLKAKHIVILGGRLLAGFNGKVYHGTLDIVLTGTLSSPVYTVPDGPNIGAKALGVYGALELHGEPHNVIWAKLKSTVLPGSTAVTLAEPVDWSIRDEFVIATTGFSAWETETRVITSVSDSKDVIGFTDPLLYTHLGETHSLHGAYANVNFDIRAEVGLLSRNIRIMGDTSGDVTYTESLPYTGEAYGARVIVGRTIDLSDPTNLKTNVGYANLSSVEFHHTAQDGFVDPSDPRFSLVFMDLQDVENTVVRNCSFVRGFGSAIGLFGSNNVVIQNNVFYRVVGHAILDMSSGNRWLDNLATMTLWPGTFNGRAEYDNKFFEAAFEGNLATNPIIQGNTVAGAERSGYRFDGERCSDTTTPAEDRWRDNTAHSVMMGIFMLYDADDCHVSDKCSKISNFIIYKAWAYGFYSQTGCSLRLTNMQFYDNHLSLFNIILYPNAEEHLFDYKYLSIEGGMFVGQSPSFDCARDQLLPADANNRRAGIEAAGWFGAKALRKDHSHHNFGKMGIGVPLFLSGDNMATKPGKKFHFALTAVAMYGLTTVKGTYFAYYGLTCNSEYDYAIATNPMNPDVEHHFTMEGIKRDSSVDMDSLVFIESPSLKFASTDECVDMICEAKKAFFIVDKDGNFIGRKGSILPDAAFEYNGATEYGIGDNRVPIVLSTALDGSKVPLTDIYDHRGIVGSDKCDWNPNWNALSCPDTLEYERVLIESMDEDFMTRRLSPLAMVCEDNADKKFITIVSNPRSVGICHGYACTARMSTFFIVAAKGTKCSAYFTGSTPQHLRLHTYNVDNSFWTIYAIYMGQQYRYDVSYNGAYVKPPNYAPEERKYLRNPPGDPTFYFPKSTDMPGANYFDVETKTLHVLVKGTGLIDIELTPQIIMAATMELMTEDDFFASDSIVQNLANFLQIDQSKIKIMTVVSASKRKRRSNRDKRSTGVTITFMIGNDVPGTSSTTNVSTEALIAMSNKLILESQTGSMSDVFGTVVSGILIAKPAPPVSDLEAWNAYTMLQESAGGGNLQPVYKPSRMDSAGPFSGETSYEGKPFVVSPKFKIMDSEDRLVPLLAAPDGNEWQVKATLNKSDPFAHKQATLTGATVVNVVNGYADFTTLGISHAGYNYKINFAVINPSDIGTGYTHTMDVAVVPKRGMVLNTALSKMALKYEERFDVEVMIKEIDKENAVTDLQWKGDTWTGRVFLNGMIDQQVEMVGNGNITFGNYGYAKVTGLFLRGPAGRYAISAIVRTATADYAMVLSKTVEIVGLVSIPETADSKVVELKFDEDYAKVKANMDMFLLAVYNLVKKVTTNVEFYNMAAREGSIYVNFTCHGKMEDVDAALMVIADEIKEGGNIRFGESHISYSPYMKVNHEIYKGLDSSRHGLPRAGMIALCVLGALLAAAIIIVVVVLCCKKNKSKKLQDSDSTSDLKKNHEYNGGHGQSNISYLHGTAPSALLDEKPSKFRTSNSPPPYTDHYIQGSFDASQPQYERTTKATKLPPINKNPTNKKVKASKVQVGDTTATAEGPLSAMSRPSTAESRPGSRSSVISKQGIMTSFSPRFSIDEGSGPSTIPTIQD